MNKKKIAILGSTGSIGTQTLYVIEKHPDLFEVELLTANNNSDLLIAQAIKFRPNCVVICNKSLYKGINDALKPYYIKVFAGEESISDILLNSTNIDIVVTAMVGFSGVRPTIAAIKSGKKIALANKETLVACGSIITSLAKRHKSAIIPVDSEHSAIFQSLQGEFSQIDKILLTASGGPFFNTPMEEMASISLSQALNHPRWNMGRKVTIDSATMMNKGFEIIEAKWLFGVEPKDIDVVVHPQSTIHSMVQFKDGSVIAQLSIPDMRIPIQYALSYPERLEIDLPKLDFSALGTLTFASPDMKKFRCMAIAYESMKMGGNIPCVVNAANEIAVAAFLNEKISFIQIADIIEKTIEKCTFVADPSIDDIFRSDHEGRTLALNILESK